MSGPCCPCTTKVGDTFGLPPEPPVGAELKVVDGDGNRFTSPLHPVGIGVPIVAVGTWDGRNGGEIAMTLRFEIFDGCEAVKKDGGTMCQRERGHVGDHCATGFEYLGLDNEEEPEYLMYPIYWREEDSDVTT